MLYETMFKRKSVRRYKKDDLDPTTIEKIKEAIKSVKPLFEDVKFEVRFLEKNESSNNWAPRYLAIFSEKKNGYLLNAGYVLQQLDLYVQSIGLGSCWVGLAIPFVSKPKYSFVIMIAVGYPLDETVRELSDFKRKNLAEITDSEDEPLMQPVRLAPSAVNSQPWYFKKSEDGFDVYRNKKGLSVLALNNWNKIDIGIALLHLRLSIEQRGNGFEFFKKINSSKISGYDYMLSVQIK